MMQQAEMNGILIVDKPSGMTSHDVVDFIRRKFHIKKVGHAGTLDPLATGVLVVLIGKATKLSNKLLSQDKKYQVTMMLGKRTDTGDADGKTVFECGDLSGFDRGRVEKALEDFRGEIEQIPPMTSAIKIKGKKLYELARAGLEVKRDSRKVHIYGLSILGFEAPNVELEVSCSKGTYVRTLCDDIGQALGCGAHVSKIRRVGSGEFRIEDAILFPDLRNLKRGEVADILRRVGHT
ncbi:MAG: tRNA pseudouridine(55) synthase TruB [Candidatus Omnitrophota bacterium]